MSDLLDDECLDAMKAQHFGGDPLDANQAGDLLLHALELRRRQRLETAKQCGMSELGRARVHSAEAACSAFRMAWASGPGYCYDTTDWQAYDLCHTAMTWLYDMPNGNKNDLPNL